MTISMLRPAILCSMIIALTSAHGQPLRDRALETLDKALDAMTAFQRNGGWGVAWTQDESIVWGEWLPISKDWITVQAPATPVTADTYLRAGQVLKDSRWIDVARAAHEALCRLQSPDGGLPHEGPPVAGSTTRGSFDDGTTTRTLDFFINWWRHTGAQADRDAVDRIGNFILVSQYADSGGWPQSYPPSSGYGNYITFNDGNFSNIVHALFMLARETGDARYLDAALRGGECILKLQGGEGEAIWAQQYDPQSLAPAWARKFEPPGYTPAESVGVCNTLVELYTETGDDRYVASLGRALAWYKSHMLDNGKYARLYEPGTQRPVYGRRDIAEKVYDVAQACEGYAWQGDWYPSGAAKAYEAIQTNGGDAFRRERQEAAPAKTNRPADGDIERICDSLNEDGTWTRKPDAGEQAAYAEKGVAPETPMILLGDFNARINHLLDYVAAGA